MFRGSRARSLGCRWSEESRASPWCRRRSWESRNNAALSLAMQPPSEIAALDTALGWKGAIVLLWLVMVFTAERLRPADDRRRPEIGNPWQRLARNAALWLANSPPPPFVVAPLPVWAGGHALPWRPLWWSGMAGLVLAFALADPWIFLWDLAHHVVPPPWRFHALHTLA